MARLPDTMDLGSVTPRRARGIVSDQSGQIAAQATSDFAGNINNIVQQVAEREDKFSYASAKSSLLQADLDTRKSLENDPDWSTYETRYTEAMTKQLGESAKLVRGNRDRALFQMDAKLDLERGAQEIRAKAKSKEIDWGRAETDSTLEALRNSAISAEDQATSEQALMAAKDKILGAKDRGYLNEQEATNAFQSFRDSFAQGKLETLPADKRIEQLNDSKSVARFLQPDARAKLLKIAQNESREVRIKGESQIATADILAKHRGDWKSALSAAKDIADPEVQDATVSRIKQEWAVDEKLQQDNQLNTGERALAFINAGGKWADLPLDIKNNMKPSALNSLRSYAEQGNEVKQSDPNLIMKFGEYLGSPEGMQQFGEEDPATWVGRLTKSDFEQYNLLRAKVRSGSLDGKDSGFRTTAQLRTQAVNELFKGNDPKTVKKKGVFIDDFETRLKAFQEDKGKHATANEAKKILDDMTVEVALSGWFGGTKKAYELTDKDIGISGTPRSPALTVPRADRNEIISVLHARNIAVTEDNIIRMYRSAK